MTFLSTFVGKVVAGLIVIALVLGFLQVRSCQQSRQKAAEARLQGEQGTAAQESARDAIAAQSEAQARERASEALTRSNEKEIRDAEGANVKVGGGVHDAGLRSLCRRPAYINSERCKLLVAPAR